uniref:Endoplasmic reticulum metallopeptidase 1 n=1 Tax=Phallusia mammillata TaxID=59560 RepID=A0A6F9DCZ6_9ASCI|nr:endoplasmic reticulum metallopeptidase 1-like [Phallusia mammillata]
MDSEGVRRRQTRHEGAERKQDTREIRNGNKRATQSSKYQPKQLLSSAQWAFMTGLFYFSILLLVWLSISHLPTPKTAENTKPQDFIEELARKHLLKFVSLGHRPAGSTANEVDSVKYILQQVLEVKQIAPPSVKLEVDVQKPTGSFSINFLSGFASYYTNITNTVVKLSPADHDSGPALLLNCHTDSVVGSPGASDDAVACAVLLEVLRALVADKETPLRHTVIFLFNGAEENILQASHGFITKHKWAKHVKAFINLEAAGAGGKEIVFQTGPENPWLLMSWIEHAQHPFGTVFAQELFQSGVVPSDTDFRIFRDYGKVPGLDLAYVRNGYVYHTQYDNADMIKPGCVQRAGDNILSVVKHLVKSPTSMLSKSDDYKHGTAAFADFLGVYMFFIPFRLLSILNIASCAATFIYIFRRFASFSAEGGVDGLASAGLYGKHLIKATAAVISSLVASILASLSVAGAVMYFDRYMPFYSQPVLAMFLYVPPSLLAILVVHSSANKYLFKIKNPWQTETIFFDAALLLCAIILFELNQLQVQSSFLLMFTMAPLVLGRCYLFGKTFSPGSGSSPGIKMLLHLLLLIFPTMMLFSHFFVLLDMFIPLCGRAGSIVPPDLIIAFLTAFVTSVAVFFTVSFVHVVKSIRCVQAALVACIAFSVIYAVSNFGFPYSSNPSAPTPKRLFLQHTARDFYGTDGKLTKSDSGLWVNAFDYNAFKINLGPEVLFIEPVHECEGLFCHWPFVVPVDKLVKHPKYLPAKPPVTKKIQKQPLVFSIGDRKDTMILENSTTRIYKSRFEFTMSGPDHMSLCLGPLSSSNKAVRLSDWSIEDDIDSGRAKPSAVSTGVPGRFYTEWFFIYYGSGLHQTTPWQPWFELTITEDISKPQDATGPVLEVAASAHYYSESNEIPVPSFTPELENVISKLHEWVTPVSWASLYKNYLL